MQFEFATATQILFGPGTFAEAAPRARQLGSRALVVIGRSPDRAAPLLSSLQSAGLHASLFQVEGEPSVELALQGAEFARSAGCDLVLGLGGGSVIDAGKAIAALLTNSGDIYDYLEVVGQGQPLRNPSAPYIAIPTTAGTGSEVTRNAVLSATKKKVKVSLRSPFMLPRLAIVDPVLTHSLPAHVTAATGLDALTQVIEPLVSNAANPMTDALCREAIARGAQSLRRAVENGEDGAARSDMSLVSLFGGLALANARLGAVHGFAGPIGGMFPAPHGAVCARLLPAAMEANLRALRERAPGSSSLPRFTEIAGLLTGDRQASAEQGIQWLKGLVEDLKIPGLSAAGIGREDFPAIIAQARQSSSMKGNPVALTDDEMARILADAL